MEKKTKIYDHPLTFAIIFHLQIMIAIAWAISLLLCIPQAFIFVYDESGAYCKASFIKGWGIQAYIIWFSFTNFFIPFVILLFCYSRICYVIWDNVNSKTTGSESEKKTAIFTTTFKKWRSFVSRRKLIQNNGFNDNQINEQNEIIEDPEAINSIEPLQKQRRESTSPSESSMESVDQRRFKVSHSLKYVIIKFDLK